MHFTTRVLASALAAIALVACGGSATTPPAPPPRPVDAARSALVASALTATADGTSGVTLTATARDAAGGALAGRVAVFSVTGASAPAERPVTGADGVARVTVTSTLAGAMAASVTIDGVAVAQRAAATFVAGPAASLSVTGLEATVTAGATSSVTVTARDAHGNVATGYRGTVRLTTTDPGATVPADATFQESDAGARTFSVTLVTAGSQGVDATDALVPSVAGSAATRVAPAAASRLAFTAQPAAITAGGTLGTIHVAVLDAFGNRVEGSGDAITLSLPGGAPLLGTASQVTSAGLATFADLSVETAGRFALTASSPGLAAAQSELFAVTAASPSATLSAVTASPSSLDAGGTSVLRAALVDLHGNPVPGVAVTFAATGDANDLVQLAPATDPDGVATGSLRSTRAEPKTVTATAGALALTTRPTVTFTPGPPSAAGSSLVMTPAIVLADGTPALLTATLVDPFGNPVAGAAVTFSSDGDAAFVQPSGATDPGGVATGTVSTTTAGPQVLTASAAAAPVAQRQVTFVAPVDPARSTVAVAPASVPADGTTFALVTVTLKDGLGRAVPGARVTLSHSGVAATFSPSVGTSNAAGVVVFSARASTAADGNVTATVDLGGRSTIVDQRPALAFTAAGAATHTIGGVIFGLGGDGLVLGTDGEPDLAVTTGATSFTFAVPVPPGTPYAVFVKNPPVGQTCRVLDAAGTVGPANVLGVVVDCAGAWKQVAAGDSFTLALTTSGDLFAWGANGRGQLGDGSTISRPSPVFVGSGFAFVAAGQAHSLAVKTNGDLYAWGFNYYGALGDGSRTDRYDPTFVGTGFATVAAGWYHSLAVKTNGDLYAWGNNGSGKLGDGSMTPHDTPVLVGSGFASVAAGEDHSLGLKANGDLFAWGSSAQGQLGDGSLTYRLYPVLVGSDFGGVAAGALHSVAVKRNGDLYAWGLNGQGELGDGTTTNRNTPTLVGSGFSSVAAGWYDSLGVTSDGDLYSWSRVPTLLGSGFATAARGASHSVAVKTNGELVAWGRNWSGELGDGSTMDREAPVLVASDFAAVAAGDLHSLGLNTDGDLYAWGRNTSGQLGDGSTTDRSSPVRIGSGFAAIAAGSAHSLALRANGDLYAWGDNASGQLGDGTTTQRHDPVLVGTGFTAIAAGSGFSFALRANGDLLAWGANRGALGDGGVAPRSSPALVGSGFAMIAGGGAHALGVKTNGDLYAWGYNGNGRLGDGSTTDRTTPVLVGSGFASASAGGTHSLAVKTNGDLYAWGDNYLGRLGDGTMTERHSPVFIGAGFAFAVASPWRHSFGVKTNGDLYAWGESDHHVLGEGTATRHTSPVLVATGVAGIASGIAHALAIRTNGELYGWGGNDQGMVGDGHAMQRTTAAAVPLLPRPDNLAYAPAVLGAATGTPLATALPTWIGVVTGFTVSPALPDGLALDPVTGAVSGTPTGPSPATSYAVTATGPAGRTTTLLTIRVD